MSCHFILCHVIVMSYHALLCHVMSCYVIATHTIIQLVSLVRVLDMIYEVGCVRGCYEGVTIVD